jgi:hypothetical protein
LNALALLSLFHLRDADGGWFTADSNVFGFRARFDRKVYRI